MLKLTHRRDLLVAPACHPRGQGHLSAASGLVQVGARCYVVADDENHIGALDPDGNDPVQLLRVLEGDLPDDKTARTAAKADLETLVALRPTRAWPAGALFAIGSGSRPNRRRGVVLPLAGDGGIVVAARRVVDLAPLYAALSSELATLNIEGAVVAGDDFVLLHRGNGVGGVNACIAYDAAQLLAWLAGDGAGRAPEPRSITPHALGAIAGVALAFTDATALPGGGWMFSAVAEASDDTYADGASSGSVIGFVRADGVLGRMHVVADAPKIEGLSATVADGRLCLLAVTDADDPDRPSQLLSAELHFGTELTGFG